MRWIGGIAHLVSPRAQNDHGRRLYRSGTGVYFKERSRSWILCISHFTLCLLGSSCDRAFPPVDVLYKAVRYIRFVCSPWWFAERLGYLGNLYTCAIMTSEPGLTCDEAGGVVAVSTPPCYLGT